MRRLLPHPLLSPGLMVIWLLLANSLTPGQVLLGALLGWGVPLLTRGFWPEPVRLRRPWLLLRYLGVLLWDIGTANVQVARLVLGPPQALRPGFVVLPLRLRSELAISLLANTICLTPGTVSARLSSDGRELLIHALDLDDPQALIQTIRDRYEAPLLEVFDPC